MSAKSSQNKRIAKNTLLLYFRSLFLILISLYTSRVILQSLGISDYGIYNVVGGMVAMFTMISSSMATASQRFITYALGENDSEKLRKVFSTSITLHIVIGAILVILLEIFGVWFLYNKLNIPIERVESAFWVLQLSIATLFVNVISVPFNAAIIAHERMSAFAYISILDGILKLLIAYSLLWASSDRLVLYAVLMFMVALTNRVIYSVYSHRHFEETRKVSLGIEHGLFREMATFAGWNMFGSGSKLLRTQGVDVILNLFFGVTVNAAKGICNQVHHAVYQFVSNFQTAVNPQLTMSVAQHDYSRTHDLIIQGGRFSFYMLCLFAVPLMVATPEILSIWLVAVPDYTVEFVRWTLIYLLLDSLSRFLINAILAYGQIKVYQIVVGGTKLLILPLVYVWLLLGGEPLVGIWANIILEVVSLCLRMVFNRKYNGLSWYAYTTKAVLPCWGVFAITIICAYLMRHYMVDSMIPLVLLSFLTTALVIAFIGFNKSERQMAVNKIQSFVQKHRK